MIICKLSFVSFYKMCIFRAIPGWFIGHCDILAKPFPYDTHECFMMIGTSSSSNVVLQPLFENGKPKHFISLSPYCMGHTISPVWCRLILYGPYYVVHMYCLSSVVVQTYMPSNPEWNLLKTQIIEPNQIEFNPTAEKGKFPYFISEIPYFIEKISK